MKSSHFRTLAATAMALLLVFASGCSAAPVQGADPGSSSGSSGQSSVSDSPAIPDDTFDSDDLNASWSEESAVLITLNGDSIAASDPGVAVSDSTATITAAGTYLLRGSLSDGQIVVDAPDTALVRLVLDGVDLSCSTSAPIHSKQADKTVMILAQGSQNTLTDGKTYQYTDGEDEPNAALFAKDDLTITGSGSLTVTAQFNNGIGSKDDLKITGGTVTVTAMDDGLVGRDLLAIQDGTITVDAQGDALKSSNDEDSEKGRVLIAGGDFILSAGDDGIQAESSLLISGGALSIQAGQEGKGIKANTDLTISGGVLSVEAGDDGIHSNGTVTLAGGTGTISCGDDGVHADGALTVSDGEYLIQRCTEGLEGASVTLTGGTIRLTASDDGVNAASDNPSGNDILITGGLLVVDASGDGLDANGFIQMSGGTVLVNGPSGGGDGALDYDREMTVTGGVLVAVGSAQMAQAPSSQGSTQYSVIANLTQGQAAGTPVTLADADGNALLTFVPTKAYQSAVLSTSLLEEGGSYQILIGGAVSGEGVDGLYGPGCCQGGEAAYAFTVSETVTALGNAGFGGHGGMGSNGDFGGQRPDRGNFAPDDKTLDGTPPDDAPPDGNRVKGQPGDGASSQIPDQSGAPAQSAAVGA